MDLQLRPPKLRPSKLLTRINLKNKRKKTNKSQILQVLLTIFQSLISLKKQSKRPQIKKLMNSKRKWNLRKLILKNWKNKLRQFLWRSRLKKLKWLRNQHKILQRWISRLWWTTLRSSLLLEPWKPNLKLKVITQLRLLDLLSRNKSNLKKNQLLRHQSQKLRRRNQSQLKRKKSQSHLKRRMKQMVTFPLLPINLLPLMKLNKPLHLLQLLKPLFHQQPPLKSLLKVQSQLRLLKRTILNKKSKIWRIN